MLVALLVLVEVSSTAQPTNAPAQPVNYSTFSKFISERNIFNPNRFARAANAVYKPRVRTVRRNSFGLTGTMRYDEGEEAGIHAFFDGTSAEFRKALQPGGTIALFKIAGITADSVTLLLDTNSTVLKIGQQMRDDGQGHWSLSTETVNFAQVSTGEARRSGRRSGFGQRNENGGEATSDNSDTNSPDGLPMPPDFTGGPDEPAGPDGAEPPAETNATEPLVVPAGPGGDAIRRLMELRAQEEQQSGNRN